MTGADRFEYPRPGRAGSTVVWFCDKGHRHRTENAAAKCSAKFQSGLHGKRCWWGVTRGGPSSGGSYDRLNRTRTEDCGRPATEVGGLCARHRAIADRRERELRARSGRRSRA